MYVPLIIAAGGGGRGYSSQSETQLEQMDYDPSQPGRNGKSNAAGTLHTALVCVGSICVCSWLCAGYNIKHYNKNGLWFMITNTPLQYYGADSGHIGWSECFCMSSCTCVNTFIQSILNVFASVLICKFHKQFTSACKCLCDPTHDYLFQALFLLSLLVTTIAVILHAHCGFHYSWVQSWRTAQNT